MIVTDNVLHNAQELSYVFGTFMRKDLPQLSNVAVLGSGIPHTQIQAQAISAAPSALKIGPTAWLVKLTHYVFMMLFFVDLSSPPHLL